MIMFGACAVDLSITSNQKWNIYRPSPQTSRILMRCSTSYTVCSPLSTNIPKASLNKTKFAVEKTYLDITSWILMRSAPNSIQTVYSWLWAICDYEQSTAKYKLSPRPSWILMRSNASLTYSCSPFPANATKPSLNKIGLTVAKLRTV